MGPRKKQFCPRPHSKSQADADSDTAFPSPCRGFGLYPAQSPSPQPTHTWGLGRPQAHHPSSPRNISPPSQAHLIGLHVAWEEATSFDGLITSQVDGHHSLLMVLLTQFQHLKGPVWERGSTERHQTVWEQGCPAALLDVLSPHLSREDIRSSVLSSDPDCCVFPHPSLFPRGRLPPLHKARVC